jgi:ketosteroid isomerase-like protein
MAKPISDLEKTKDGARGEAHARGRGPSRRIMVGATVALPFAARALADTGPRPVRETASAAAVADLVSRTDQAAKVLIRGDVRAYVELVRHADDFVLMQPFGGPPGRGFDRRPEHLTELARFFNGGESALEVAQTYASGDLVVLAFVERQHGQVGGLPDQDWSLRVTQVYRRTAGRWELVHRHADPLVHRISVDQGAALARGS